MTKRKKENLFLASKPSVGVADFSTSGNNVVDDGARGSIDRMLLCSFVFCFEPAEYVVDVGIQQLLCVTHRALAELRGVKTRKLSEDELNLYDKVGIRQPT